MEIPSGGRRLGFEALVQRFNVSRLGQEAVEGGDGIAGAEEEDAHGALIAHVEPGHGCEAEALDNAMQEDRLCPAVRQRTRSASS